MIATETSGVDRVRVDKGGAFLRGRIQEVCPHRYPHIGHLGTCAHPLDAQHGPRPQAMWARAVPRRLAPAIHVTPAP